MKQKVCRECGKTKPLAELVNCDTCLYKKAKLCKACGAAARNKWRQDNPEKALENARRCYRKNWLHMIFKSAKTRSALNNIPFNLTETYIQKLWTKQNEHCALSGIPFDMEVTPERKPFRPSLDRIVSTKGYVKGNVRFILFALNIAINKHGLPLYLKIAKAVLRKQEK
jgi:hypothetical protein